MLATVVIGSWWCHSNQWLASNFSGNFFITLSSRRCTGTSNTLMNTAETEEHHFSTMLCVCWVCQVRWCRNACYCLASHRYPASNCRWNVFDWTDKRNLYSPPPANDAAIILTPVFGETPSPSSNQKYFYLKHTKKKSFWGFDRRWNNGKHCCGKGILSLISIAFTTMYHVKYRTVCQILSSN